MKKIPVGLIIKQIIKDKGLDIKKLAQEVGIARTTVYQVFGRSSLSEEDLQKWSKALNVTTEEIIQMQTVANEQNNLSQKSYNSVVTQPDEYLLKYMAELEARINEQSEQLKEKDQVIKMLLGKSEGVSMRLLRRKDGFLFIRTK